MNEQQKEMETSRTRTNRHHNRIVLLSRVCVCIVFNAVKERAYLNRPESSSSSNISSPLAFDDFVEYKE